MASSAGDQYKFTAPGYRPTSTNSPPAGTVPAMGYPAAVPYHQPPYAAAYPYNAAPPPAAFYVSQSYDSRRRATFFRCLFAALIAVVILAFVAGFVTWLALRPKGPAFQLDTLSVINFNANNATLSANWDSNFTISNPNAKLDIFFDQIQGFLLYEENLLSMTFLEPFRLGTKKQSVVRAEFWRSRSAAQPELKNGVVAAMDRDRKNGTVRFNLRMELWTTFKAGWWTGHSRGQVLCENLEVGFVSTDGGAAGTFTGHRPRECLVLF